MILDRIRIGMTRPEIVTTLGDPMDCSVDGLIFKYGDIELHFTPDGVLWLVYSEDEVGEPTIHAKG